MRDAVDPALFERLLDELLGAGKRDYLDGVGPSGLPTFRFNPLKHAFDLQHSLLARQGFEWSPVAGSPVAFRLGKRPFAIGQSLAHVLGHIYVQDLSSTRPVTVLDPQPGDRVLDMCASPGSKTTQIAAAMGNRGLLLANDVSNRRIKVLVSNLQRYGVLNTGVRKGFGEQCGNLFFEAFDRVLLDPPCSALGTVGKSPEILGWWSPERTRRLAAVQKNLIFSALKALKPGGVLVYSTCTIAPEENEEVVASALERCPVELEQIELAGVPCRRGLTSWRERRFGQRLERAVRLYPFETGGEGFFIARLRKLESFGQGRRQGGEADWSVGGADGSAVSNNLALLQERFALDCSWEEYGFRQAHKLYVTTADWKGFELDPALQTLGLPLAHCYKDQARLTTEGTHLFSGQLAASFVELPDWAGLQGYVNRVDGSWRGSERGQVAVTFRGHAIGHALIAEGCLKSRFPRTGVHFELVPEAPDMSPASQVPTR